MAIPLAVIVYAFIDVLVTPAHATRRGPKALWALAVIVLPLIGAVLWFVLGRPRRGRGHATMAPDDDTEFLRDLDRRLHRDDEGHTSDDDHTS
jgi:hypothetical protein